MRWGETISITSLRAASNSSAYVLPNQVTGKPYASLYRCFIKACKAAGIEGLRAGWPNIENPSAIRDIVRFDPGCGRGNIPPPVKAGARWPGSAGLSSGRVRKPAQRFHDPVQG